MSLPLGIAIYFLIWWTLLFAILPIGVRTQGEAGDIVPGTPASAPVKARIVWVVVVNTVVSAVVMAVFWAIVTYRLLPLERLSIW